MDPNSHSDFISFLEGGSAFIEDIPDRCEHDYQGDPVYFTASGKKIYWHTFRAWAGYTTEMRYMLIQTFQDQEGDPIVGGAITCSKCGKEFTPPSF